MTNDLIDLDEMAEALRPHLSTDLTDDERREVAAALIQHLADGIASGGNLAFIRDGDGGRIEVQMLTLQEIR